MSNIVNQNRVRRVQRSTAIQAILTCLIASSADAAYFNYSHTDPNFLVEETEIWAFSDLRSQNRFDTPTNRLSFSDGFTLSIAQSMLEPRFDEAKIPDEPMGEFSDLLANTPAPTITADPNSSVFETPLPPAAPLLFAGLAGLYFGVRRRK